MKKVLVIISFMQAILCFAQKNDSSSVVIKNQIGGVSAIPKHSGSFGIAPTLNISTTTLKPGVGIVGYYSPNGKKDVFASSITFFHSTASMSELLYPYNPNNYGRQINAIEKINSAFFQTGYLHYFKGDFSNKGFKMYMTAGLGLEFTSFTVNHSEYDNSIYYLKAPSHSYKISPYAYLGIGIEKSIGKRGSLFAEINNNFYLANYSTRNMDVQFPYYKSINLTMGYKYRF